MPMWRLTWNCTSVYKTPDSGGEIRLSRVGCMTSEQNGYVTFIPIHWWTGNWRARTVFKRFSKTNDGSNRNSNECHFSCLPLEIREANNIDLPTSSFLNLRYTSRAMGVLFDSPVFWKSRFSFYGERGYLHMPINNQQQKIIQRNKDRKSKKSIDCNWRLFYHCTNPTTWARMTDLALQVKKQI